MSMKDIDCLGNRSPSISDSRKRENLAMLNENEHSFEYYWEEC